MKWILEETTGNLIEAPHFEVNDKVIDLEFEKSRINGLKRIIKAMLKQKVTDKYGNNFQLKNDAEVAEFMKKVIKNPQVQRVLKESKR